MKWIVAGGRDFTDWKLLRDALCLLCLPGDTILSGMARGADRLGVKWAHQQRRLRITLKKYPADWNKHGKSAGIIRNQQMAQEGDALIVFWDGRSKGTRHMIEAATREGLNVHIYRYTS